MASAVGTSEPHEKLGIALLGAEDSRVFHRAPTGSARGEIDKALIWDKRDVRRASFEANFEGHDRFCVLNSLE